MKHFASFIGFSLLLTIPAAARIHPNWTYDELTKNSALIVIATPVTARDTGKTTFPGISQVGTDNIPRPVPAIGMEANFKVLSVLKGDTQIKTISVSYLAEVDSPGMGDPEVVVLDPKEEKRFLLFLQRDPDGRYSSVTGQVDPMFGIKDLGTYP
jgi:hypothetical protein